MVTRRAFLAGISSAIVASLLTPWAVLGYARRILGGQAVASPNGLASGGQMDLPLPSLDGTVSLERALAHKRSIREYTDEPITPGELSQILWAAYGVSKVGYGFRTTPSAGATYPLNIYAVAYPRGVMVGDSSYLAEGSYIYIPEAHRLGLVRSGDLSRDLYRACLEQDWVLRAKAVIVITATYERTTRRYGDRGVRYVLIEVRPCRAEHIPPSHSARARNSSYRGIL